jgi:site-specific DNA-methyltransferase (adenine-specific)
MGKRWDGNGTAFNPDTWAAFASVLHPGAFGCAFASSRGWHRLAVAIEDAGLVIHPSIFGWAFGSGFPKATRIDTQIDKAAGVERTEIERTWQGGARSAGIMGNNNGTQTRDITAPATPLARAWSQHRYGLQCLKPALEPIIVFQKPYAGRAVDCITSTGAGALWIEGGRVGMDGGGGNGKGSNFYAMGNTIPGVKHGADMRDSAGRWPANLIITDEAAAARLDQMSGERPAGVAVRRNGATGFSGGLYHGGELGAGEDFGYGGSGGASRFFYNTRETIDEADPLFYCAKASRRERDAGLEGMPERTRYEHDERNGVQNSKTYYDPRNGKTYDFKQPTARNPHPTVKPIALTEYLARLLLPPVEYAPRRIFNPFGGVMSEAIGCALAGWEEVVSVELMNDEEHPYVDIGRKRADYWIAKGSGTRPSRRCATQADCDKSGTEIQDSQERLLF